MKENSHVGEVTPQLDPGTIALCNAGFGDVSIQRYQTPTEGDIDLFCADSGAGYIHIREQHQGDWQTQVDGLGGGVLWDDWMEYQLAQAVRYPAPGYPLSIGNQKSCYTAPIEIFNTEGGLEYTFFPTIITSQNNAKVITAVPTTNVVTSNCTEAE